MGLFQNTCFKERKNIGIEENSKLTIDSYNKNILSETSRDTGNFGATRSLFGKK